MKLQFKLSYKKANDIFVNHTTYEYDEYKEDDLETEKFSKRPLFKEVPNTPQEEDLSLSKYEDDDIPDFDTLWKQNYFVLKIMFCIKVAVTLIRELK